MAELQADARRRPEAISYATSGAGALAHVATTQLQRQGNFRLTHVPYRGGGPALQDALAGHVPLFMSNAVIIAPHIRSGALRPLAVTTRQESRHLPGVPSFAQLGFGEFEALTWWALMGPARTPEGIVQRMHEAVHAAMNEPTTKARVEEQGADVVTAPPAEARRFLLSEIERWGAVIRETGITAEG